MTAAEKVKLARWFNARGVRMMKCAGHVESCSHYKAFKELADAKFAERDRLMGLARVETGKHKVFMYQIESLEIEGRYLGEFPGVDELDAGQGFEQHCEEMGIDPGIYRAELLWRVRL